jgi:hypothetical protein
MSTGFIILDGKINFHAIKSSLVAFFDYLGQEFHSHINNKPGEKKSQYSVVKEQRDLRPYS